MNKKQELKEDINDDLGLWKRRFADAYSNQTEKFEAFQRWYDAFYAVFKGGMAPWRSKVIDPKVAAKIFNIIAKVALFNVEPNLRPRDKHDFVKAKNNQELLMYQQDNPDFDEPIFNKKYSTMVDMGVCGVGYAMLPWKSMDKKSYKRIVKKGKVDLMNDKETMTKLSYNDFVPISVFKMFVEPGARSFQIASWKIIQDAKDDKEIEEFAKLKGFKYDKSKLGNATFTDSQYEQSRDRLLTNDQIKTKKREFLTCYDEIKKEYTYIVDKKVVLGKEKNINWHQKFPVVPFYIRPRAFSIWGDGLFERVERLGAANDDLINQFLDQLDLSVNGLIMHSENTTVDADISPGGSIIYSGTEKPEMQTIPQPDANGFQLARQVIDEAIEENTISNYNSGIQRSETDKTQGTATGTVRIQEAGNDIIRFFKKSYSESCKLWYGIWMINNMQFLDRKIALRVLGSNGYYPKEISPEDIVTQGTVDIEIDADTMESPSKDVERQFQLAYIDRQLVIAKAAMEAGKPIDINYYELSKIAAEGTNNIKRFDYVVNPIPEENDSPSSENELMLMGKETEPQQGEDHKTHMFIHKELIEDEGVDQTLKDDIIIPHMEIHKQFLDQVMKEIEAEAATAKQLEGRASEIPFNTQNPPIPQDGGGQQGSMAPEVAGAIPNGAGVGNNNPLQRV